MSQRQSSLEPNCIAPTLLVFVRSSLHEPGLVYAKRSLNSLSGFCIPAKNKDKGVHRSSCLSAVRLE